MYNKVSFLPFCGCISKEWHPLRAAISPVLPIFLYLLFETKFSRFEIHFGACSGEAISNLTKKNSRHCAIRMDEGEGNFRKNKSCEWIKMLPWSNSTTKNIESSGWNQILVTLVNSELLRPKIRGESERLLVHGWMMDPSSPLLLFCTPLFTHPCACCIGRTLFHITLVYFGFILF